MRQLRTFLLGSIVIALSSASPASAQGPIKIRVSWVAPVANWASILLEKKDLAKHLGKSPEFSVATQWLEHGRPVWSERRGTILVVGDDEYRIPSPLFQILGAVDLYRAAPAEDESARIKLVASLQEQLPQDGADNMLLDQYLRSFRVQHAAAFSLTLRTEGAEFSCDPILFGRRVHKRASGGEIISESEALLTPHQQDIFAGQRFGAFEDARAVYTIERGLYVHVDPALQKALGVVRRVQRAPSDIRRNFA